MDETAIKQHLTSTQVMGVYPMLKNESCYFLAMDFDKEHWMDDVRAIMQTCSEEGVPAAVERSRSGNGGHVWIFFSATAQAIDAAGYWYGGGNNGKRGSNGYGPLGGPTAGNVFGCAQQFEVHAPVTLSELSVNALIGPGVGSTTFSYKLYLNTSMKNGHPVPDNNSLVRTSDPITYSKSEQENIHSSTMHSPEKVVAFEYCLQPGKYWLAEEGDPGGPSVYVNHSYIPEGHLTTR